MVVVCSSISFVINYLTPRPALRLMWPCMYSTVKLPDTIGELFDTCGHACTAQ